MISGAYCGRIENCCRLGETRSAVPIGEEDEEKSSFGWSLLRQSRHPLKSRHPRVGRHPRSTGSKNGRVSQLICKSVPEVTVRAGSYLLLSSISP